MVRQEGRLDWQILLPPEKMSLFAEHRENLAKIEASTQKKHDSVNWALSHLTPTQAKVTRRIVWERMTHKEIAEELGLTTAGVNKHWERAKHKLEMLLEDGVELGLW